MSVISYGSLNLDYVYSVPHFVAAGETLSSTSLIVNCGGKGLNQSIAAARAGADVFHAGKIGEDGAPLEAMLTDSGVDTRYLCHADGKSGHAIIQVSPQGENCILLHSGSNACITRQEIESTLSEFGEGDVLILQNEVSEVAHMIRVAAQRGIKVVFNPSPFDDGITELPLELVDVLIFNQTEGAALTGGPADDADAILSALRQRLKKTELIMTLGSKGSVYDDGTTRITQAAFKVEAVDTTAAGDTFTGYFVAARQRGDDVASSLLLASAASALAVTVSGAAQSIPTLDKVERFVAERNL